jgi:hypothetical protein
MSIPRTKDRYMKRVSALKQERSSWIEHWRDLNDYILPRRGRFMASERNKGTKANRNIINSTATRAVRILASGMMAGITSPARPWFRLTTPDPDLAEFHTVKQWLHDAEDRVREAFAKSNIYNALPLQYVDLSCFGTAPAIIDEDEEDVLRAYVIPVASYCLANSSRLRVDTMVREPQMTVAQVVERFGLENCSQTVKNLYSRGSYDEWIEVVHVIEPNREQEEGREDYRGMPFRSCWFEAAANNPEKNFLQEGGYREFPVVAPRWNITGEDVYGHGPGMDALGDVRALQMLERRKAQLVDKLVNPPMKGPSSLRRDRVSLLPGDYTPVDTVTGGQTFQPAMEVNPAGVTVVSQSIAEHEERINGAFYADLWLMMARSDSSNITAREIEERHEEKMLQLGPVLERLQDELLDPLIDRAFAILQRRGELPPAPPELSGMDLRVEYISILAQAQKLLGISTVERLTGFIGSLAQTRPDALDKLDVDKTIDEYAAMLGTKPDLVLTEEQVAEIRAARAQKQQAAAQGEAMAAAASGAKDLAAANMNEDNALTRLVENLGGEAASAAGGGGGLLQ